MSVFLWNFAAFSIGLLIGLMMGIEAQGIGTEPLSPKDECDYDDCSYPKCGCYFKFYGDRND